MRKSDILIVALVATRPICFSGCAMSSTSTRSSMAPEAVHPTSFDPSIAQTSVHDLTPSGVRREILTGVTATAEIEFSWRLHGGILIRFEPDLIVVKSTDPPASPQPTALTTDAIITTSVKSKIADQLQLRTRKFDVQTDNGVVTIRAKEESLEDAASVINLALAIPEVRQIIYAMPTRA